jgi:hypothetical protein
LQPKSGGSRKKSGAAAAGARQQLSGFEGCEPMFGHADIYPKYQAGKCQAWHSGEHSRGLCTLLLLNSWLDGSRVVLFTFCFVMF